MSLFRITKRNVFYFLVLLILSVIIAAYFYISRISTEALKYTLSKFGLYDISVGNVELGSDRFTVADLKFGWGDPLTSNNKGEVQTATLNFTPSSLKSKSLTEVTLDKANFKLQFKEDKNLEFNGDISFKDPLVHVEPNGTLDFSSEKSSYFLIFKKLEGNILRNDGDVTLKDVTASGILKMSHLEQFGEIPFDSLFEVNFADKKLATILIKKLIIKTFNGIVSLSPLTIQADNRRYNFKLILNDIDLAKLLELYPQENLSGTGKLNGAIPIKYQDGIFTVEKGELTAKPPGGKIAGDLSKWVAAHPDNQGIAIAAKALSNFNYSFMNTDIDYDKDGKLAAKVALKGSNPELQNGQDINLNVNIEDNIPALLETMNLIKHGPTDLILSK